MRMLSFYEEPRTQQDDAIKNELQRRIFLEIQRRLPDLLNRKITHYVSSINREANYFTDEYLGYQQQQQQQQPATTTTAPTTTTTTPASTTPTLRTLLISHSSFRRPQPRPYTELVRSPTPSYTYQHQYTQQVRC